LPIKTKVGLNHPRMSTIEMILDDPANQADVTPSPPVTLMYSSGLIEQRIS
jgi:hypothetical protein